MAFISLNHWGLIEANNEGNGHVAQQYTMGDVGVGGRIIHIILNVLVAKFIVEQEEEEMKKEEEEEFLLIFLESLKINSMVSY